MAEGHLSPPGRRPSKACLPSPALALQEACSHCQSRSPEVLEATGLRASAFQQRRNPWAGPQMRPASLWCLIQSPVTLGCPLERAHLVSRYFLPTGVDRRESSAQ